MVLRGCWYDDTVRNVHATMENLSDDTKGSSYEYHLGDLGANGSIILK
jgi:hypothetical protein